MALTFFEKVDLGGDETKVSQPILVDPMKGSFDIFKVHLGG